MGKNNKIIRYRRGFNFDIGFVIFLVILLYVFYGVYSYLTANPVAEYEVKQGTIATNNTYTGIILRDETVVSAESSGNINYYIKDASKVSVHDVIYSVDTDGRISQQINTAISDGSLLSSSDIANAAEEIDYYLNTYESNNFSSVYSFKEQMSSELNQSLSSKALTTLSDQVSASSSSSFKTYSSASPGIISYIIDGFESLSVDDINQDSFNAINYSMNNISEKSEIKTGEAAYKIINSDNWKVIIPVSKDTANLLKEENYIKIKFTKDGYSLNAASEIIKKGKNYFIALSMKTAMIRYIDERFLNVELVLNSTSGLKIPISSITEKEFFVIPKDYLATSGDSQSHSVLVQKSGTSVSDVNLVKLTVYYEDDKSIYIDSESINEGDSIVKTDSKSSFLVGSEKAKLKGVYNINKGYAVFRYIEIISQNDDYALIKKGTSYSISLYDHIALDSSKVTENQTTTK